MMKNISLCLLTILLSLSACQDNRKLLTKIEYYDYDDLLIAQYDYTYDENDRLVNQVGKFWNHVGSDPVILNHTYTYAEDKIGVEVKAKVKGNRTPENFTYILNSDSHIIATYMESLESINENKKDSLLAEFNYLDGYLISQNGIYSGEYRYQDENQTQSTDNFGRRGMIDKITFKYSELDDKMGVNALTSHYRGYYRTQSLNAKSLLYQQGYWGNKSKKLISSINVYIQTNDGQTLTTFAVEYEYTFTKKGYITEIRPQYSDLLMMGRSSIYQYCKLYYND